MIEPLLAGLQQWVLFAGVTLVVGCVAWRFYVAPGVARELGDGVADDLGWVESRVARMGALAGIALLLAWFLRGVVQVMGFRDPFAPLSEDISFLLFETFWGTVWMAQGALIPLLTLCFWRAGVDVRNQPGGPSSGRRSPMWPGAALLTLLLVTTLALSGHAMGVDRWKPLIVAADWVHTLGAGLWIGTLAVITLLGRPAPDSDLFRAQITRFSPMALGAVAAIVLMGLVLSWTHLTALSDLWTINYGRVLAAKILLVMTVLGAGFVNWRKGVPALADAEVAQVTWRRAVLEVSLAGGVLLLTAILVHSVKP